MSSEDTIGQQELDKFAEYLVATKLRQNWRVQKMYDDKSTEELGTMNETASTKLTALKLLYGANNEDQDINTTIIGYELMLGYIDKALSTKTDV